MAHNYCGGCRPPQLIRLTSLRYKNKPGQTHQNAFALENKPFMYCWQLSAILSAIVSNTVGNCQQYCRQLSANHLY